jgi:hypothetical protein
MSLAHTTSQTWTISEQASFHRHPPSCSNKAENGVVHYHGCCRLQHYRRSNLGLECRSSSNPAFGSVRFAPTARRSGALKANATVRANALEELKAVRQVMVGLLAMGVILVTRVLAFAFTSPGGEAPPRLPREPISCSTRLTSSPRKTLPPPSRKEYKTLDPLPSRLDLWVHRMFRAWLTML